jgi:ABC-type nitrate/sulfonate/bicarbonate transport system substrate-binding protein
MTLTVQLDWKPNSQFAGLLLALHNGWFEKQGVYVKVMPWQPATDPVANVPHKLGLIAVSEDNLAIQLAAAGNDVKILGSMLQKSPLAWMVMPDSQIKDVSQFKGKTIGVHVDGITGLQFAMKTAGLALSDANVIDVPFEKLDQLREGTLDVCQANGLVEPIEMAAEGTPVRVFWAHDLGYSVYSQVLSTSSQTIAIYGEEVKTFMSVLWQGWTAVYQDIPGAAKIIYEQFLNETSIEEQIAILKVMEPFVFGRFSDRENQPALGSIDSVRLQESIDLLIENKVISFGPDVSSLLDWYTKK